MVISDSEDEDEDDSDTDPVESSSDESLENAQSQAATPRDTLDRQAPSGHPGLQPQRNKHALEGENDVQILHEHTASRSEQRGFKRYRAWELALQRNRGELEAYRPDANGQGNARAGQDARVSMIPEDAGQASASAGSVPTSNGFVPRPTHRPQAPPPHTGAHPGPSSAIPLNRQALAVDDSRAPWTPVVRHVSPSTHRLEDMLVRSIEPASPEGPNHPSFMRPHQNLPRFPSPSRHGMQYRPGQPGHDPQNWTTPAPIERPLMSERAHQEVLPPGSRHVGYGLNYNTGHDYPPQHIDPATRLRSPVALPPSQVTAMPNAPSRTVIVNASRPGERSNPIFMEDRGGFFERVQTPTNGTRHHNIGTPERPSQWSSYSPHRASGAPRGGAWDERPRATGYRRDDPDVEMVSAPAVASFPTGQSFDMPHARYPSPAQPPRAHETGYGHLPPANPGFGAAVAPSDYGAGFEHRPGADM